MNILCKNRLQSNIGLLKYFKYRKLPSIGREELVSFLYGIYPVIKCSSFNETCTVTVL